MLNNHISQKSITGTGVRYASIASLPVFTMMFALAIPMTIASGITASASAQGSSPICIYRSGQVQGSVIQFGQEGGNIKPFAVKIDASGTVTGDAPNGIKSDRLSPSTVQALIKLARAEHFWSMPELTGGNTNPDVAARFITIHSLCATHHVVMRRGVNEWQFAELYSTLSDLLIQPRSTVPQR